MSDRAIPSDHRSPGRDSLAARLRATLSNPTVLTVLVAVLGGVIVFLIATEVFPYHSNNDDEAVYLQQAAMLLEGQLRTTTEIPEAFRPWFFVMEENALYSKYSPVPAAVFALGMAIGAPRLALAAVAAGNVLLVALLTMEAFDRQTGLLAAVMLVATPFFLLTSAVFLPYPPTTLFNLTFALAYVRTIRRRSLAYGALAGIAIGLAFFARPYTALLFALPFVVHACWRLVRPAWAHDGSALVRETRRYTVIGVLGLLLVGVTLWYNWIMTGSALLFPYQEFAPNDGLGFGTRKILGYSREYTPGTALVANWQVITEFATRWTVAAPFGTILAAIGVGVHFRSQGTVGRARESVGRLAARTRQALTTTDDRRESTSDGGAKRNGTPAGRSGLGNRTIPSTPSRTVSGVVRSSKRSLGKWMESFEDGSDTIETGLNDGTIRTLFAGLFVSVIVGNVYFWGNLNLLAGVYNPTEGFLALYGPFYHFDLLLALSAFGAFGLLVAVRRLRRFVGGHLPAEEARAVVLALLLVTVPIGAVAQANALDTPLSQHMNNTEQFERAYEPVESTDFKNALVFLPPVYGDWLNHPFQYLRNGPSLRGDVVYALSRSPGADFTVIEAYENRTLFRYTFRGVWGTGNDQPVRPRLKRLQVRNGSRHRITTALGVPPRSTFATVRIEAGLRPNRKISQYTVRNDRLARLTAENGSLRTEWVLGPERAQIVSDGDLRLTSENQTVPLDRSQPVSLEVTFLQPGGGTITYHYELSVSAQAGLVRVIWPPRIEVCRLTANCGYAETYLPGTGNYTQGISVTTTIETRNRTTEGNAG